MHLSSLIAIAHLLLDSVGDRGLNGRTMGSIRNEDQRH